MRTRKQMQRVRVRNSRPDPMPDDAAPPRADDASVEDWMIGSQGKATP